MVAWEDSELTSCHWTHWIYTYRLKNLPQRRTEACLTVQPLHNKMKRETTQKPVGERKTVSGELHASLHRPAVRAGSLKGLSDLPALGHSEKKQHKKRVVQRPLRLQGKEIHTNPSGGKCGNSLWCRRYHRVPSPPPWPQGQEQDPGALASWLRSPSCPSAPDPRQTPRWPVPSLATAPGPKAACPWGSLQPAPAATPDSSTSTKMTQMQLSPGTHHSLNSL